MAIVATVASVLTVVIFVFFSGFMIVQLFTKPKE